MTTISNHQMTRSCCTRRNAATTQRRRAYAARARCSSRSCSCFAWPRIVEHWENAYDAGMFGAFLMGGS